MTGRPSGVGWRSIARRCYNADLAAQRYNLGNLASNQDQNEAAIEHYRKAIKIDDQFFPAKANLANLYNRLGNNEQAEQLLREVVVQDPQNYEMAYSLGLLLAEMGKLEDSAIYLGQAATGMPDYGRGQYNYALALLKLKRYEEGAEQLHKTLAVEPRNREFFATLIGLYMQSGQAGQAVMLAQKLLQDDPEHPDALEFLDQICEQYGK